MGRFFFFVVVVVAAVFIVGKIAVEKKNPSQMIDFVLLLIHHDSTENRGHVTSVEPKANYPL